MQGNMQRNVIILGSYEGFWDLFVCLYVCVCVCVCACVWDSCCSQWYNLFIPLNLISLCVRALSRSHALSLSLSPCYSITRLQDALTLSPFSSPRCRWRSAERPGSVSRLHYVLLKHDSGAHSHKRLANTHTLRNTEPTRGSDKMWIISHPTGAVSQTKGQHMHALHTYMHIHVRSCVG